MSILLLASPLSLAAQQFEISRGDTVLVSARDPKIEKQVAILAAVETDRLRLSDPGRSGRNWEISIDRVTRLDVRRSGASSRAARGAVIGLLSGMVVGALVGYGQGDDELKFINFTATEKALMSAPVGGGFGVLIGALVGTQYTRRGWQRVKIPLEVAVVPSPTRGFGVSATLVF